MPFMGQVQGTGQTPASIVRRVLQEFGTASATGIYLETQDARFELQPSSPRGGIRPHLVLMVCPGTNDIVFDPQTPQRARSLWDAVFSSMKTGSLLASPLRTVATFRRSLADYVQHDLTAQQYNAFGLQHPRQSDYARFLRSATGPRSLFHRDLTVAYVATSADLCVISSYLRAKTPFQGRFFCLDATVGSLSKVEGNRIERSEGIVEATIFNHGIHDLFVLSLGGCCWLWATRLPPARTVNATRGELPNSSIWLHLHGTGSLYFDPVLPTTERNVWACLVASLKGCGLLHQTTTRLFKNQISRHVLQQMSEQDFFFINNGEEDETRIEYARALDGTGPMAGSNMYGCKSDLRIACHFVQRQQWYAGSIYMFCTRTRMFSKFNGSHFLPFDNGATSTNSERIERAINPFGCGSHDIVIISVDGHHWLNGYALPWNTSF